MAIDPRRQSIFAIFPRATYGTWQQKEGMLVIEWDVS